MVMAMVLRGVFEAGLACVCGVCAVWSGVSLKQD